jgi:serine protease AprX
VCTLGLGFSAFVADLSVAGQSNQPDDDFRGVAVSIAAVEHPPARGTWTHPVSDQARVAVESTRDGIAVAIIDSGVQPHADLPLTRIRAFKDFISGSPVPIDTCGHGTHVAGIIAGNGRGSRGAYAGIAPGVAIVALRVLGDDCSGKTSAVIEALEWIGRHHIAHRIKVVNLSLGHSVLESIHTDPLVQSVERLSRKGIAVVTASGNKGINAATGRAAFGGAGAPCNAPSAICVGSLDTLGSSQLDDDRVPESSARGPTRFDLLAKPDLVAPGVNIVSLAAPGSRLFAQFPGNRVAGADGEPRYFVLSGTSMAAPSVAAAAALLLEVNQGLSVNALKLALQFTARILSQTDVLAQGAGALNIAGAVKLADAIDAAAPRGRNWIRHRITAANVDAFGQFIRWGQRIVYGDRFMSPRYAQVHLRRWDDDVVWAYDAIAGDIAWDNAEDDNIVWGNDESDEINIVWDHGELREAWAAEVIDGFWWSDRRPH